MYLKLSTMQFPLYEGDIRLEHPEITEDQTGDTFPIPDGFVSVALDPIPEYDQKSQSIFFNAPEQNNGNWTVSWRIEDLPEEIVKKRIEEQNDLLAGINNNTMIGMPNIDVNGSAPSVIE